MARAANKRRSYQTDEKGRRKNAAKRARALAERKADSMPVAPEMSGPKLERVVDAPLVPPSPKGGLFEVFQRPYLLKLIVQRELANQYAASVLGLFWSYVQPAVRFLMYFSLIGVLRAHGSMPHFALHLFTGMVVVHYFSENWSGATRSIWSNRPLVLKMRVPRETFPVAAMVVAAIHTFPQIVLLVVVDIAMGWKLELTGLAAGALGLAILMSFSAAMGLTFAALNAMYKDWQNIVATMMQFMHFMVPMMYPFSMIWRYHDKYPVIYQLYMANPVSQAVIMFQRMFWEPTLSAKQREEVFWPPDMWVRGFITLGVCLVLLFCAQAFFKKFEAKFPERL